MEDKKKRRIVYCSEGNDDISTVCDSVENAINMFRADVESLADGQADEYTVSLTVVEMTDSEVAAIQEF